MKIRQRTAVANFPSRNTGQREAEQSTGGEAGRGSVVLQGVRDQVGKMEEAIRQTRTAREAISESASGAAGALSRFEQALRNLQLSLDHQRFAAAQIDTAAHAGEAAALLRAQILGAGGLAAASHHNSLSHQVLWLLEQDSPG